MVLFRPMGNKLRLIAAQFGLTEQVLEISSLGAGNVNDTFLVTLDDGGHRILQRLNVRIFRRPEQVMENLRVVHDHLHRQLGREHDHCWEVPELYGCLDGGDYLLDGDDGFWRLLGFIESARTFETIQNRHHAREIGRALGCFHRLLSNLDPNRLHDVLPGFHVTPVYLAAYDSITDDDRAESIESYWCRQFIEERREQVQVLENARARGELLVRPIHGDPKANNIMTCVATGKAVALIDLDTVKPGLVHYDIGDCLRSCCNPAGEETRELGAVRFELDFCREILTGYLGEASIFLNEYDRRYFYEAARLLAFELGLRFFADWLTGNRYFKTTDEEHNLRRALVQFRLCASIESQEKAIRALVEELP
jgi:Ser/Thr protein kinase RdoA (MazF antagonist)